MRVTFVVFIGLILGGCLILNGCSKQKPLQPPGAEIAWEGEAYGLVLRLKAGRRLNWHDNQVSSLLLCVYQLNDRQALENLAKAEGGLEKLLQCRVFDDSAVTADRLFISPGETREIFLDRQKKTSQVAVVAGYYDLDHQRAVGIWNVPLEEFSRGWFRKPGQKPGQLVMNIILGANEILPVEWQLVF